MIRKISVRGWRSRQIRPMCALRSRHHRSRRFVGRRTPAHPNDKTYRPRHQAFKAEFKKTFDERSFGKVRVGDVSNLLGDRSSKQQGLPPWQCCLVAAPALSKHGRVDHGGHITSKPKNPCRVGQPSYHDHWDGKDPEGHLPGVGPRGRGFSWR